MLQAPHVSTPLRGSGWFGLALACWMSACGDDRPVPFGQESGESPVDPEQPPPFEPTESQAAQGVDHAAVEGAEFSFENSAIYALLTEDVDGDGDRDVLALTLRANEALLVFGRREGGRIVTQSLGSQRVEACVDPDAEATIVADSPARRVGTINVRCGDRTTHVTFVASAGQTPRLRERIAGRGFAPRVEFPDIDNDGHEDLRAILQVEGTDIVIDWLDRPGGLARDRGEPAATLESAGPRAAALGEALCGQDAAVAIGGRWGLECPPALLRQIQLSTAVSVAQTDLPAALQMLEPLGEQAEGAFFETLDLPNVRATSIAHILPESPATRHAALSFQDETTLIDHASGLVLALSGLTTPYLGGPPIPSADGTQGVRAVSAGRDGRVRIDLGDAAAGPVFHGRASASILIPGDADANWLVLGWAPQGFLLFDGARRLLMTLDGSAQATIQPLGLSALPAPLHGARTSTDGDSWVAETPFGVLVGSEDALELWRPREWDRDQPALACALSPSGQRVAIARADGIWLLSRVQPSSAGVAPPTDAERLP